MTNEDYSERLMAEIVHRLNNTLGIIRVLIRDIEKDKAELLREDKELAEMLAQIRKSSEKAMDLIDQMSESVRFRDVVTKVSVSASLDKALSQTNIPSNVKIVSEVQNDPRVMASDHLIEVFNNLLANAIDAMPQGGKITITTNKNQDKNSLEIYIEDTGMGIPERLQDSLFDSFYTTKHTEGHGFGLWWCKRILRSIGGDIELASSSEGQGTIFRITIPLAE